MTYIENETEYEVSELLCLKCLKRWIATYPSELPLKDIVCQCGEAGYVIKTGQTLPDIPDEKMENDIRFQNMVRMWGKKDAIAKYREYIWGA